MQDQDLTIIDIKPGVVTEQTPLAAGNFWIDADKVRFRYGKPECIGGWQNVTVAERTANLYGTPRIIETLKLLDDTKAAVIATNVGVFSSELSEYYNVTPLVTAVVSTNILNTTAGSPLVVVSINSHGLTDGSLAGFVSAIATIGGNIVVNSDASTEALFQVSVIDANSFSFNVGVTAAATSASTGGHITANLYLPAGEQSSEDASGWGTGEWGGDFGWGEPASSTIVTNLRQWSMDLWGASIMAVPDGGKLYWWNPGGPISNITERMVVVTAAPSVNGLVRVASEARHVILYGTHDVSGDYDPLLIRWCSQENFDDWTPTNTNTAGEYRIGSSGSKILSVTRMADKQIILTDSDLFVQSYIGPSDVFGFVRAADNCGVIAPNAAIEYNGVLYWMSNSNQFYKYDGRLQTVPCTVLRFIFNNLDRSQSAKIIAGTNSQFDELIWFYVSNESPDGEPDRYVILNPIEGHWTIGTLARTAWIDRNVFPNPIASGVEGEGLFYHETGYSDNGSPMTTFVESGMFTSQQGNVITFCNKFVPDFSGITEGDIFNGIVDITIKYRKYPSDPLIEKGPYTVDNATSRFSTRMRGREYGVRIGSYITTGQPWRLGEIRMGLEVDGER